MAFRSAERHGDEPRSRLRGLDPHQHVVAARLVGGGERIADVGRPGDLLASDIEDDVTGLETTLGGRTALLDADHRDALAARALDLAGRGELEAEARHAGRRRSVLLAGI